MAINSRTKGANFEREIGNLLVEQLDLKQPVKRILEQTRTKELPDLKLGRWCLECKRYGDGAEPSQEWWDQVLSATGEGEFPALIYKFNRRPIKVRVPLHTINNNLMKDDQLTCDLAWKEFIFILKTLYPEDIARHQK